VPLPVYWLAPGLWLAFYPLGQLLAQASAAAYRSADAATREATGRELSRPFATGSTAGPALLSIEGLGMWLGIGAVVTGVCWLIERLAGELGWTRPVELFLRVCLGFFLFSNVMLFTQRLRNVWFFRRIRQDPGLLSGLQRQDPTVLYWNGLLINLQAALLLAVAAIVAPSGWLWGGAAGLLWQAWRFFNSAREAQEEREAAEPQG